MTVLAASATLPATPVPSPSPCCTAPVCAGPEPARQEMHAHNTASMEEGCSANFSDDCCGGHAQKQPTLQQWLHSMLHTQFFTPCLLHAEIKKNEATHFCVDCGVAGEALCQHCIPQHAGHKLIQIRRYVYCDVVRACDMSPYVDVAGIQTYIINQAKVIFLNHRPQTKMSKAGASDACLTCSRALREGCSYCSLACKIESLAASGQLHVSSPVARAASDASDCYTSMFGGGHVLGGEQQQGCQVVPSLEGSKESEWMDLQKQLWQQQQTVIQQGQQRHHKTSQAARRKASALAHQQRLHYGHQRALGMPHPVAAAVAMRVWAGRRSSDSENDSDTKHSAGSSHCSRRKQLSPRRSPML